MPFTLTYQPFGPHAILVSWPQEINETILADVLYFKHRLSQFYSKQKVNITHAYCAMLVNYIYDSIDFSTEVAKLKKLYLVHESNTLVKGNTWQLPVCYHHTFGLDLEAMSKRLQLNKNEIITLHTQPSYLVYFIGFLPGFLYLGGLDKKLHTPRKETPRLKINKGDVAIGGNQTGIYPNESPGGWNIIGSTPVTLFDASREEPCMIKAGDRVKFVAVSMEEYQDIQQQIRTNTFQLIPEES